MIEQALVCGRGAHSAAQRRLLGRRMSAVSLQRFAVEFDRRVVGIAVRVPGGFLFFSSDEDFQALDGQMFPRARAISRRLEKLTRSGRGRADRTPNLWRSSSDWQVSDLAREKRI